MNDIAEIAEQLGVNEKDTRGLVVLNKVLKNRIVVAILAFALGLYSGIFFPRIVPVYPYLSGEVASGIGISRAGEKSFLLTLILGILSFVVGFALSSQIIFAIVNHSGTPSTLYGVFAKRGH